MLVRPIPAAALIDEQRDVPDILTVVNDEANMLDAMPDHYLRGLPDGRQELVETTGGSPTPTRFLVDYSTADRLTTHAGPRLSVGVQHHRRRRDSLRQYRLRQNRLVQ